MLFQALPVLSRNSLYAEGNAANFGFGAAILDGI
jgi:hypothetical protein